MRRDVKIGIIVGLLVVAGIVAYFWFTGDDDASKKKPEGRLAKTTPGDSEVKLPQFASRTPPAPEAPGAPADSVDTPPTEPGALLAQTPEPGRAAAPSAPSDVTSPGLRKPEPSGPLSLVRDTAPSEPPTGPAAGDTTPPEPSDVAGAGRKTVPIGLPAGTGADTAVATDTGAADARPVFDEFTPKPKTAKPTPPKVLPRTTPPEPGLAPGESIATARRPAEPSDVIRVTGTPGVGESPAVGRTEPRAGDTTGLTPGRLTPGEAEPVAAGAATTYQIRPGDKLWNIAERLYGRGHLWTLIYEANPGIDPSNLRVGTALTIPPAPRPGPASDPALADAASLAPGYRTYTVQKGEGFWKIAAKFYGNGALWTVIAKANPTLSPTAIREGRTIVIPPKPEPQIRRQAATEPVELRPGYRTYRVRSGDMLSTVSQRMYGSTRHWLLILEANPGVDPRNLKIGSALVIPPLSAAAETAPPRTETRWTTPAERESDSGLFQPRRTALRPRRTAASDVVPPDRPDFGP